MADVVIDFDEEQLRECFERFDTDQNKSINPADLRRVFKCMDEFPSDKELVRIDTFIKREPLNFGEQLSNKKNAKLLFILFKGVIFDLGLDRI